MKFARVLRNLEIDFRTRRVVAFLDGYVKASEEEGGRSKQKQAPQAREKINCSSELDATATSP